MIDSPSSTADAPAGPRRARSLSRRKKLLFGAITLLGVLLLAEIVSLALLWLTDDSPAEVIQRRRAVARSDPVRLDFDRNRPVMLHPYLGSVLQPRPEQNANPGDRSYRVTAFGFPDTQPPIRRRSADRLLVAIVGGSVARQLAWNASALLERELSQIPSFRGRNIELVRLAADGYKQPQQLMTITYLLTLGAEFDLVINLDGVNEAALPRIDNFPHGVAAAYPRKWGTLAASGSVDFVRRVGYIAHLRDRRRAFAAAFETFPWRYSPTGLLLWKVGDDRRSKLLLKQLALLESETVEEQSYCASGPPESYSSEQEYYEHCVDIWARSSVQLQRICSANGTRYFHFLQPNQHVVPLSKPMGSAEAALVSEASPFRQPVMHCYPLMQASAERLKSEGVDFCDLTQVFADHPEQIYYDDCCHVQPAGDEIMAHAIVERIRASYAAEGP